MATDQEIENLARAIDRVLDRWRANAEREEQRKRKRQGRQRERRKNDEYSNVQKANEEGAGNARLA